MRFHIGRDFRADGERNRKSGPRSAAELVFAARSRAAEAARQEPPSRAPFRRALAFAAALAVPLFGTHGYLDARRMEPTMIVAQTPAPVVRQAEPPRPAAIAAAERPQVDPIATGSTPPRQERSHSAPPPAKARRTAGHVGRSAGEISKSQEPYR